MPLTAKNDYVFIKPDPMPKKIGLIHVPKTARNGKDYRFGTVKYSGPGALNNLGVRIPTGVKPGDRVLYEEMVTEDHLVPDEDKKYSVIDAQNIVATIEEE